MIDDLRYMMYDFLSHSRTLGKNQQVRDEEKNNLPKLDVIQHALNG